VVYFDFFGIHISVGKTFLYSLPGRPFTIVDFLRI
jgi:hypothetical protein